MKKNLYFLSFIIFLFLTACDTSIAIDFQGDDVEIAPKIIEQGESLGNLPTPTRQGFVFDGWHYDLELNVPVNSTFIPEEDIMVYASWIPEYEVKFNTNGGNTLSSLIYIEGENAKLSDFPQTSRPGFVFQGWYLDSNFINPVSENTEINQDLEVYARWIQVFEILFDSNGGNIINPIEILENETFLITELPTVERPGFVFDGWYLDANLNQPVTDNILVSANIMIYAKWLEIFSVRFETNQGSQVSSINFVEGENLNSSEIPVPTRPNYVFDGWFSDSSLTQRLSSSVQVNSEMVIYAGWILANELSFETNSELSIPSIIRTDDEPILLSDLPSLSREGFIFNGWYLDQNFNTKVSEDIILESNVVIYAKWIQMYQIQFNTNGGSSLNTIQIREDLVLASNDLPQPTRTGYTFLGWYYDAQFSRKVQENIEINDDSILYARWVINVTSITLNDSEKGLEIGESYNLVASIFPIEARSQGLTWSSSNTSVATVDSTGRVTARGHGIATITARAANGVQVTSRIITRFKISDRVLNEFEPNNFRSSADFVTFNGTTIRGRISSRTDVDNFRITIPQDVRVIVVIIPQFEVDIPYYLAGLFSTSGELFTGSLPTRTNDALYISTRFTGSGSLYLTILYNSSSPYSDGGNYSAYVYWE